MKQLSEFNTIAQARAYEVTTKKLISADTMRIFMLRSRTYKYFKEATCALAQAAMDTLNSNGEFNFMEGHSKNVLSLFDLIVEAAPEDKKENLKYLESLCVAEANRISKPYENITDSDWEQMISMKSPTTREALCPGDVNYIALEKGDLVHLTVTPTDPIDHDDILKVTCLSSTSVSSEFSADGIHRGTIVIPKGTTGPVALPKVNTTGLLKLAKIVVTSKYNRDFQVVADYGV